MVEPTQLPITFGGGSSTGACVGPNCFLLSNYGSTADVREVTDASWSGGGSTITCPNNDCNFTPADTGKLCFAMPSVMTPGPAAPGTLTYISAQSVSCTAAAVIGSAVANGTFTWGHDDTPAFLAATAALFSQPKCGTLILPAGRMFLQQGLSPNFSIANDCGISILGQGYTATTIELLPGFKFGTVTNNIGCTSSGCFWNSTASSTYQSFSINGEWQNLSGLSTAPANSLFSFGGGAVLINVDFFNWATSTTNGPIGVNNTGGTGPYGIGLFAQNWGNNNMLLNGTPAICQNCGSSGVTLQVQSGGTLIDTAGTYNGGVNTSGGTIHAFGTRTPAANGAFSSWSCQGGSTQLDLNGVQIGAGTPASAGQGLLVYGGSGTCTVHAKSTSFNGGSSGGAIAINSGTNLELYLDDQGNSFSTPMIVNSGGTYKVHHREAGTCVFTASTTCVVTFAIPFGSSANPTFLITPVNPGAVTFTVTALSPTAATITGSGSNSLSVGWEAVIS